MVNRIYHWLSGKEKYGRHYCLAGTGFAGELRVLRGSPYKSKTRDGQKQWRRGSPPEKHSREQVFQGETGLVFHYCFFVLNISLFFLLSKRYNPVTYFILRLMLLFVQKKLKPVSYFLLKLKFATFSYYMYSFFRFTICHTGVYIQSSVLYHN
jgi:hypothetical protein